MTYHKEELKRRIIEVAFYLVTELGYNYISTRMIANELDTTAAIMLLFLYIISTYFTFMID